MKKSPIPKPAQKVRSEVHRHFSGSKASDFPAQGGHFPVRQRSESGGVLHRAGNSGRKRHATYVMRHEILDLLIFPPTYT
jgi:hypothetical protein